MKSYKAMRPLSIIVACALVVCLIFPLTRDNVSANTVGSGTCGENLTWELDDEGTLRISGTGPMTKFQPPTVPVPWGSQREQIKKVILGQGVTQISQYAFYYCENLTSVSFPSGLTDIGYQAFYYCRSLTSVVFPESLTSIGSLTFDECRALRKIKIPNKDTTIGHSAFHNVAVTSAGPIGGGYDYEFAWTDAIPDHAFANCNNLSRVTLPDSIKTIGNLAFAGCSKLSEITLPSSLEVIGNDAFDICPLLSVTIPSHVTTIGARAFECRSLTEIHFLGSAPSFFETSEPQYKASFCYVTATATFPCNDASWTASAMRTAGGNLTWRRGHHFSNGICTICGQHGEDTYPEFLLSDSRLSLEVGQTKQISFTGAEAEAVKWRTGNTDKASVDQNGVVTAKSQGNTWLYATTLDNREAKCLLMISDTSALTLPAEKWLNVGDTFRMEAENANGQELTWSVGNKSIATVDGSGNITGRRVGNTWLYVTSSDGRRTQCILKVRAGAIAITFCGKRITEKTVNVGTQYQLYCANTGNLEVIWRTGNSSVATVGNGVLKGGVIEGISVGNTWLYATLPGEQEVKCLLRVIPAATASVRYTEKTIKVGSSFQFELYDPQDSTATWWVGNTSIAQVDQNGLVTGLSSGNTWLHFRAEDGRTGKCLLKIR